MQMETKKVRLVQCWDDGIVDDIRLTEILRKYDAKASFNLNFDLHRAQRYEGWKCKDHDVQRLALPELRDVYEGFIIANHSATHPHLADIPPAHAFRDILDGKNSLEQHFGCSVTGFAYPFGSQNDEVAEMLRETGHVYGRVVERTDRVFPVADPMVLRANCHFLDTDFWPKFESVASDETADVFYFWGHSYENVDEQAWEEFDKQIERLSEHPRTVWADLPSLFETTPPSRGLATSPQGEGKV